MLGGSAVADASSLRILMTNLVMSGRSGTETMTRDLAMAYLNAGHRPYVYARELGPIAHELIARSIPVTDSVAAIAGDIDVIQGNHLNACIGVMAKFPTTPAVFVCHDFTAWYDVPPKLANIHRYVAVSLNTRERLSYLAGIAEAATRLVLNGVDTNRFKPLHLSNTAPRRALAFAKNAGHIDAIRQLCAERKIAVDFVGLEVGAVIEAPEAILGDYDLIFASARSATEAMACNLPVIVCDGRGLAGMVDVSRYHAWRDHNFGLKVLLREVSAENLRDELDRYDPLIAAEVGSLVRSEANMAVCASRYIDVLREAMSESAPSRDEAASALSAHLEMWAPRSDEQWPWLQERDVLIAERNRLNTGLEPLDVGDVIAFDAKTQWRKHARLVGFHDQEEWGLWTGERNAYIRLAVGKQTGPLELDVEYMPFAPADGDLSVEVHVGATHVATWVHAEDENLSVVSRILRIPDALNSSPTIEIIFRAVALGRPSDRGNRDTRQLGMGLRRLALRHGAPTEDDPAPEAAKVAGFEPDV
ncbi:hypothetical protein sos41_28890 [Alphaproteobacteria bacterium SO-S41]|nr:hypothetical protein sos41_28890 [Alphaproteobacteria bacterium SO-S41]